MILVNRIRGLGQWGWWTLNNLVQGSFCYGKADLRQRAPKNILYKEELSRKAGNWGSGPGGP